MRGRAQERAVIDAMLEAARSGRSTALLIEGGPGIGKTCLCEYACAAATGFTTLRARGAESESVVPFTALEQLLHPLRHDLDRLPAPQRHALAGALALEEPARAPPLALGTATLALLAGAAEDGPLLAIADDVHWFDPASAAATSFAARRLDREGIAVLATRRPNEGPPFDIEDRMTLEGLAGEDAAGLLHDVSQVAVPPAVVEALITATGGNPLALRQLAAELGEAVLAGDVPLPDPLPLTGEIGATYRGRIALLPRRTRQALVVLAASASSARVLLEPALGLLGLDVSALEAAEAAGIVSVTPTAAGFLHPLMRSAAYHAARPSDLRAVHRALAGAAESTGHLGRQAWHLAAAATGPDESVAAALERSSKEAEDIGGAVAAAPGLDRAAQLTPPGELRARRLLTAANALFVSGQIDEVPSRLDEALQHTSDVVVRADAARLRAQLMAISGHSQEAVAFVRAEARLVAPHDKERAALMLCEMSLPSVWDGDLEAALEVSAQATPLAQEAGGLAALLADNYRAQLLIFSGEMVEGEQLLRDVDRRWRTSPADTTAMVPWPVIGFICIEELDRAEQVLKKAIGVARSMGALAALPFHLGAKSELDFITGHWLTSYAAATECVELAAQAGQPPLEGYGLAGVARVEAGWGREEACRAHAERTNDIADRQGGRYLRVYADGALGLLELGLGRPEEARALLAPLLTWLEERHFDGMIVKERVASDLIEAAIACGEHDTAERLLKSFEAVAQRTGRTWPRAAALRCRAVLAPDDEAETSFRAALALHRTTRTPFELARTELAYGEWLKGHGKGSAAERQLRSALLSFEHLGAVPWASRTRRHLGAAEVERARPSWTDDLTPQELRVALAVADGASNKEVAAALFLSPRTVESHLTAVFRKVGVRSRSQLTRALLSTGIANRERRAAPEPTLTSGELRR